MEYMKFALVSDYINTYTHIHKGTFEMQKRASFN